MPALRFITTAAIAAVLCALAAGTPGFAATASPTTGSITVHAVRNAATASSPVPGLGFEVLPIDGVDVATDAGRAVAASYQKDPTLAFGHVGAALTLAPTNAQGVTSLNAVPRGLYLLRQASGAQIAPYAPLVFALPTRDTANGAVVQAYNLDIYPKPPVATSVPSPTGTPSEASPSAAPTTGSPAEPAAPTALPPHHASPAPTSAEPPKTFLGALPFTGVELLSTMLLAGAALGVGALLVGGARRQGNDGGVQS